MKEDAPARNRWAIVQLTKIGAGWRVMSGPFMGLSYGDERIEMNEGYEALVPKIIGSYEAEIHDWVGSAIGFGYDQVIDIGCAEGYYAVGFAIKIPSATVVAIDIDRRALEVCAEYAKRNGVVDRMVLLDACPHEDLRALLRKRSLIFCDVEGAELQLLDPVKVPELRDTDMIVEAHDFRSPGVTATLIERFRISHRIEITGVIPRQPKDYPMLAYIPAEDRLAALDERRPADQNWIRFRAKRSRAEPDN